MAYETNDHLRPTRQLEQLLTGKQQWDDAPEAIRSWAAFFIHQAAQDVLALPTKGERRNALGKIPAAIRPKVEAEAKRIFSQNRA